MVEFPQNTDIIIFFRFNKIYNEAKMEGWNIFNQLNWRIHLYVITHM